MHVVKNMALKIYELAQLSVRVFDKNLEASEIDTDYSTDYDPSRFIRIQGSAHEGLLGRIILASRNASQPTFVLATDPYVPLIYAKNKSCGGGSFRTKRFIFLSFERVRGEKERFKPVFLLVFFSREQAKSECDWMVMSSVFVASQSSCFFLCSREQIRLVENRLYCREKRGNKRYREEKNAAKN